MVEANIGKDSSGRIVASFPYDPSTVTKVKTIEGRRWHPAEKHWSFPNRKEILDKILEVFGNNEVEIDPALKRTVPDLRTTCSYPPHRCLPVGIGGRVGEGVHL